MAEAFLFIQSPSKPKGKLMKKAKNGDTVKVNYTGSLDDGTIFDTSVGKDAFQFIIGDGFLMQAFEEEVIGLNEGESKKFQIPTQTDFGLRQDKLVRIIPFEQLPKNLNAKVGMKFQTRRYDGQLFIIKIIEVSDDYITVISSHELAGKDLNFEVKLVEIVS
jgi:peptidylprolyl isomerase